MSRLQLEFEEPALIPEKKLIAAIIKQAWNDLSISSTIGRVRINTIAWINKKETINEPWSFEWCCEHINMPVTTLRETMLSNPELGARRKLKY
jgi:hypothetical protein